MCKIQRKTPAVAASDYISRDIKSSEISNQSGGSKNFVLHNRYPSEIHFYNVNES